MTFFLHRAQGVSASSQPWSFTMVTQGSVSEGAAETTWGTAIAAFFGDATVKTYWSPDWELTQTATSTASATFRQTTQTRTTHAVVGTSTAPALPEHDAIIATFRTAYADKSAHGRWYLPGWTTTTLGTGTAGKVDATVVTNIAGALSGVMGDLVTGGLAPVILTRKGTVGGLAPYTTRAISSGDVPNLFGVQGRRGDKIVPVRTSFSL